MYRHVSEAYVLTIRGGDVCWSKLEKARFRLESMSTSSIPAAPFDLRTHEPRACSSEQRNEIHALIRIW